MYILQNRGEACIGVWISNLGSKEEDKIEDECIVEEDQKIGAGCVIEDYLYELNGCKSVVHERSVEVNDQNGQPQNGKILDSKRNECYKYSFYIRSAQCCIV